MSCSLAAFLAGVGCGIAATLFVIGRAIGTPETPPPEPEEPWQDAYTRDLAAILEREQLWKGSDCHVAAPRGSRTGIQGHGVLVPRAAGWRKTAEERIAAAPPKSHLPDFIHHNLISQEIYGTANPRVVAALRAKVPDALALAVIIAAERDLAAGAMPIPTTLWAAS